jgi:molybdenum cofactor synthesis domain-containing protein
MQLIALCEAGCDVVLTTGGTGFAPRDVTPEATVSVIDRNAPGIAELLRADGLRRVPTAALGRGIAGIRDSTLIVNLPGSPGAVRDGMRLLIPLLPHAVSLLRGEAAGHV